MPKRVVIVGDLSERPKRNDVLGPLTTRAAGIQWDWVQPNGAAFNAPPKYFRPLLADLQRIQRIDELTVVKLACLHGRDQNQLYALCDPVEPPQHIESAAQLVDWLLSDDAGLAQPRPWRESPLGVGLVAVLAKLIRNKSWNKDTQGHAWTKEIDLLGQAPVCLSDRQWVLIAAGEVLGRPLFMCKGGTHGTTPKEWCIDLEYVPAVKRAITERSLQPLRDEADLASLVGAIDHDAGDPELIDDRIVNEKVRAICRENR